MNNFAIRDEKGEEVITKEVKELFKGKNGSISFDEITDSNGKVKKGLEVFDLNNDGKLDENEKSYFANGGHSELSKATKLTITDLTNAIEQLDKVGYTGGGNPKDSEITTQNKQNLHKMLSSSSYMLENLGSFPEGLQDKFAKALKEKHFYETKQKDAIGVNTEDALKIDEYTKEGNKVKYIRATDIYTPFLVGAEAGYLISGVNDPSYDSAKDKGDVNE